MMNRKKYPSTFKNELQYGDSLASRRNRHTPCPHGCVIRFRQGNSILLLIDVKIIDKLQPGIYRF